MYQRCTRIKSVLHATFHWKTQWGVTRRAKPTGPTVNGDVFDPNAKLKGMDVTMMEFAKKTGKLDHWTPVVRLYLSMARIIVYEGERAQAIWNDYKAGIFGKKKGSNV